MKIKKVKDDANLETDKMQKLQLTVLLYLQKNWYYTEELMNTNIEK